MWPGSDLVLAMWPSFGPVNWILASSVLVLSMLPISGLVFAVWTDFICGGQDVCSLRLGRAGVSLSD